MVNEEMPWLSGNDRDLVTGKALLAWIGWKLPV